MRLRFALVTDMHFGHPASYGGKLRKLSGAAPSLTRAFCAEMRDRFHPDLVVNLGDVIEDESEQADERGYREFLAALAPLSCPILHVAGNHDSKNLADAKLASLWNRPLPLFYSHTEGPLHFVVLRTVEDTGKSVVLPSEQLAWLAGELERATRPTIVLMHHPAADTDLRGNRWFERAPHLCRISNRRDLRAVLEKSHGVAAVFNGHAHWNHLDVIAGIPYVTVQSLIENLDEDAPGRAAAAWALVELEERQLIVRVAGLDPARYQFALRAGGRAVT